MLWSVLWLVVGRVMWLVVNMMSGDWCISIRFVSERRSSLVSWERIRMVKVFCWKSFGRGQGLVSRKARIFAGDIILFVSSKRRSPVTRNFAVILTFTPFTTYEKTSLAEWAGRSFTNGFSGPWSFRVFWETHASTGWQRFNAVSTYQLSSVWR